MTACPWYIQLLLSVTVKLYVPTFNAKGLFEPQSSKYGAIPPKIFNEALPSENPEQLALFVSMTTPIGLGSLTSTESINVQPLLSVINKE